MTEKCADNKSLRINLLFRIFGKEGDGFLVMTKRASNGHFMWPKDRKEVMALTPEQFGRLMHGFTIEGAVRESVPKYTG